MYYRKHIESKSAVRVRFAIVALLLVLTLLLSEAAIRPCAAAVAENRAQAQFGLAVSRAALDVFDQNTPAAITLSDDGTVSCITLDSAAMSAITSQLALGVLELFDSGMTISIPAGSLTGITALSGIGPNITMQVRLLGAVNTQLVSHFEEAGINQTLHRVECIVSAEALVLLAGQRVRLTLTSSVTVCETIIVGATPDSFTNVNGDQSDTIGRIFDYGDPYGEDVAD